MTHVKPVWPGKTNQLLWPMHGWIGATEWYWDDRVHNGSLDIGGVAYAPVCSMANGVVSYVQWTNNTGYQLEVTHFQDNGERYRAFHGHLFAWPLVEPGEDVSAGQILGYNGHTGRAGYPHIHHSLRHRYVDATNDRLGYPVQLGDPTGQGDHIPGAYRNRLGPIDNVYTEFDAEVVSATNAHSNPDRTGQATEVPAGTIVKVTNNIEGIWNTDRGWMPQSSLKVVGDETIAGVTTATSQNIRAEPGNSGRLIGVVPRGSQLTSIARSDNGWHLVLWNCTPSTNRSNDPADDARGIGGATNVVSLTRCTKLGWVAPSRWQEVNPRAFSFLAGEPIRSAPGGGQLVGRMDWGYARAEILSVEDGYYRVDNNGTTGWIRGWVTTGPHQSPIPLLDI